MAWMPKPTPGRGLAQGSSKALAKQLDATVGVADQKPGTVVTVAHTSQIGTQ